MSLPSRMAARSCCARQLRATPLIRPSTCNRAPTAVTITSRRGNASASTTDINPKIAPIVDQISQLTLLETADLVAALKSRLNIPDLPVGGAFAPAPAGTAAGAPAPEVEEEEAAPAAAEKTVFSVKLVSIDAGTKPKIIKEVKSLLGLSLVDSKKFVEAAPKMLKEGVPKEDAEKMKATLEGLGAKVEVS